jgi:hypothetical protein
MSMPAGRITVDECLRDLGAIPDDRDASARVDDFALRQERVVADDRDALRIRVLDAHRVQHQAVRGRGNTVRAHALRVTDHEVLQRDVVGLDVEAGSGTRGSVGARIDDDLAEPLDLQADQPGADRDVLFVRACFHEDRVAGRGGGDGEGDRCVVLRHLDDGTGSDG